jgi:hypothetical protein
LVKDDIGNWYLKALASDTNSIIQSAQSLALFNMGKKFDVNLLRRAELQRRADSSDSSSDQARADLAAMDANPGAGSGVATAGLSAVQKKYADDYAKQVVTDVSNLESTVAKVGDDLVAAWKRDLQSPTDQQMTYLGSLVAGESDEQKGAREALGQVANAADADKPAAGADAIINALRSVRRMRDRLSVKIASSADLVSKEQQDAKDAQTAFDGKKTTDPDYAATQTAVTDTKKALDAAVANRTQAAKTVVTAINQTIGSVTAKRLDSVKAAETAYGFIGEAATAK